MVKIKRIYEEVLSEDGFRILVDRLWPRGLSKEKAKIDLWLKEVAPSDILRKWFRHDPKKWREFQKRYRGELLEKESQLKELQAIITKEKNVTLLFAARDTEHNNAVVLQEVLYAR